MNEKAKLLNSGEIIYKTLTGGIHSPDEWVIGKSFAGDSKTVFKKTGSEGVATYSFVGTKEMKDRDGDIVMLDGIDFENYSTNPVVLWGHDSRSTPVGKSNTVTLDQVSKEAIFDIQFASTEKGTELETLVKEGILNAVSIGFIVKDWEYDEQLDAYKFTETELLEISIVNVPANPGALASKRLEKSADKSLSAEEVQAMIREAMESMKPLELPQEPEVVDDVSTPEPVVEPVVEPEEAPAVETIEPNSADTIVDLLRELLEASKPKEETVEDENTEPDSREQNNPKESETDSQLPDEITSDENTDEDHSENSPEDTEETSDNVNLVNVEDLDEDTVFTVVN